MKAPKPAPAVADYAKMTMTLPIYEGATALSGTLAGLPDNAEPLFAQVWSYPEHYPKRQTKLPLVLTPPATVTQVPIKKGDNTVTLASPLDGGTVVTIYLVKADGTRVWTQPPTHLPSAISLGTFELRVEPLKVDAVVITGHLVYSPPSPFLIAPTAAAAATATTTAVTGTGGNIPMIAVWETDPISQDWSQVIPAAGTIQPTVSNPGFSIAVPKLVAGQKVRVDVVPPAGRSFVGIAPLPAPVRGPHFETQLSHTIDVLSNYSLSQPTISTSPFYEGVATLNGTGTIPVSMVPMGVAVLRLHGVAPDTTPLGATDCLYINQLNHLPAAGNLISMTSGNTTNPFVATLDAASGTYKVVLAEALKQDEWVQIVQVLPAGTTISAEQRKNCTSPPRRVEYPFDFYRTNVDFTAGLLLSSSSASSATNADFSQASQFYALNVDHSWALSGYDCIGGRKWGRARKGTGRDFGNCRFETTPQWHATGLPGFSSFFNSRLTSIPISTPAATVVPATTATGTPAATSTAPSTLLTSQKVFRVETGVYLPWVLGHGRGERPNSLFLAPLAKAGFDTVTGAGTSSNVILPGGGTGTLNFETAYKYYAYGARIGNMTQSRSPNRAPQVEHYLDITVGRYSNLQSYICRLAKAGSPNTTDQPGTSCHVNDPTDFPANSIVADSRKQLYRLDFEGLIKIPIPATAIPFYIGFNANISQHSIGAANLDQAYAPPDDIRILFATRIDIGTLLSTFKQIGTF